MPEVTRHSPPRLPDWLERMLPDRVTRYRIEVDTRMMHVMELGEGRPVLLLHGNPTWGFLYRKVMAELAGASLRLIAPDLLGFGFSAKPREPVLHELYQHARWVRRLVELLDLEDLILVGHDWGGPIGVRALYNVPQRVTGLVMLNTVLFPPREGFTPTTFHRFARLPVVSDVAFKLLGFPQNMLHRVQGDPTSIRGDVARAYRYPLLGRANRLAPLALARMVPDGSENHPSLPGLRKCQEFAEGFAGPVAIVWGDRDPILGRVRRRMEALFPAAAVTATAAGHFPQEEVPGAIAAAVQSVAARGAAAPT